MTLRAGDSARAARKASSSSSPAPLSASAGALGQRRGDVDVEVVGVVGVHRGGRVLPVVAQRGLDLLGGGEDDRGAVGDQVERSAEVLERQQLGQVGELARPPRPSIAASSASSRCSASSSAAGASSTRSASPSERWVKVENQRIDSISSPNSSIRTARSSVAG